MNKMTKKVIGCSMAVIAYIAIAYSFYLGADRSGMAAAHFGLMVIGPPVYLFGFVMVKLLKEGFNKEDNQ